MSKLKNTDGAKKIHLTTLGNVSNPLEKMDFKPISTPNINMPSLRFWDYVMNTPFLRPEMMPPGSFFYSNVSTDVIVQSIATNRTNKGPKLNYKQWTNDNGYIDQGYYYGGLSHYGYLTDSDGEKYHIQRKSINGWDDEKFWFFDEPTNSYVEFIPTGYTPPSVIYRAYGESLGEFGERYESAINTCIAIFVGSYSGVVAVTLWRTIIKSLLNMSLEIVRQVLIEKVPPEKVDTFDVVIEGIPVPKIIKSKLVQVLYTTLLSAIQAAVNYSEEKKLVTFNKKSSDEKNKDIATTLSQIVLKTIKVNTQEFLAFDQRWIYDKGELEADLADKYFSFIVSGVIAEIFKEDE